MRYYVGRTGVVEESRAQSAIEFAALILAIYGIMVALYSADYIHHAMHGVPQVYWPLWQWPAKLLLG